MADEKWAITTLDCKHKTSEECAKELLTYPNFKISTILVNVDEAQLRLIQACLASYGHEFAICYETFGRPLLCYLDYRGEVSVPP